MSAKCQKRTLTPVGNRLSGPIRRPEIGLDRSGPTTASGVNLLGYPRALEIPMTVSMVDRPADKKEASRQISLPSSSARARIRTRALAPRCCQRVSAPAYGLFALLPASALASIVTCWITFGPRFPAAAGARMYRMARRSNTPTSPTRHGTGG